MERISQSEYQRVVEQNKKLLKDIKLLTSEELSFEKIETIQKWRESLKKADELMKTIKLALRPNYKRVEYDSEWSMFDNIISRSIGEDKVFIGKCWFIESIETNKYLDEDNYSIFGGLDLGNPHQEMPLPYDAMFTDKAEDAMKFKTKEGAEYFLCHSFNHLNPSCYIREICRVTEHEYESIDSVLESGIKNLNNRVNWNNRVYPKNLLKEAIDDLSEEQTKEFKCKITYKCIDYDTVQCDITCPRYYGK